MGKIDIGSRLQVFDKEKDYKLEFDDTKVYDNYMIGLERMSLSLNYPNQSPRDKTHFLISNIIFGIRIDSCLDPLHPIFPTLRLNVDFNERIDFDLDLMNFKALMKIKDSLLI